MLLIYHDTPYDQVILDRAVLRDVDTNTLFEELSKGKPVYVVPNYGNLKQFMGIWLSWDDPEILMINSALMLCEENHKISFSHKLFIVQTDTIENTPLSIHHEYLKESYITTSEDYSNGSNPRKP